MVETFSALFSNMPNSTGSGPGETGNGFHSSIETVFINYPDSSRDCSNE